MRQLPAWGRPLAIVVATLFVISCVFPAAAGLSRNTAAFPHWWGIVDVSLAFLLGLLVTAMMFVAQNKVTAQSQDLTHRAYGFLIHGILVFLVVFFLAGDRIVWINCLTGFAWRAWLMLYSLPAWFTLIENVPRN